MQRHFNGLDFLQKGKWQSCIIFLKIQTVLKQFKQKNKKQKSSIVLKIIVNVRVKDKSHQITLLKLVIPVSLTAMSVKYRSTPHHLFCNLWLINLPVMTISYVMLAMFRIIVSYFLAIIDDIGFKLFKNRYFFIFFKAKRHVKIY